MEVKSLIECFQVAALAQVCSIKADVRRDIATEATLVVYELFPMALPIAVFQANTKLFRCTRFASQVFFLNAELFSKSLLTANHSSKVRFIALSAFVKGAGGHGESSEIPKEFVFGVEQTLRIAQLSCFLHSHSLDSEA